MRVLDVHVYGVDLASVIFRSAFTNDTQAPSQTSRCGWGASVTTRVHIWCFYRIKQTVPPSFLWLLTTCYCHFWHEGDMRFQQDNARWHTATATQRAFGGVQQMPWPTRPSDLSPIEHVWDMIKRELTFSRACKNRCRILTTVARSLEKSIAGWHSSPLLPFACKKTRLRYPRREYTVY